MTALDDFGWHNGHCRAETSKHTPELETEKVLAFEARGPTIESTEGFSLSDFNEQPYRKTTLTKLELFRQYVEQWLPVFISDIHHSADQVNIVDFFSGSGTDAEGIPGTPLLLLNLVSNHLSANKRWRGVVHIHFNDIKARKTANLKETVEYGGYVPDSRRVKIDYYSRPFLALFDELLSQLSLPRSANLLFIDQSGNFQFTREVFRQLMDLKRTDALVFFASYFLARFKDLPGFFQGFPGLKEYLSKVDRAQVHGAVKDYLKSLVPKDKEYYVGRYTLRSVENVSRVYGVIFCSSHVHGITKFVRCASGMDELHDRERNTERIPTDSTLPLFDQKPENPSHTSSRAQEIHDFRNSLRQKILSGELGTDRDGAIECVTNGVVYEHGKATVNAMKKEGLILNTLRVSEKAILDKQAARRIELKNDKVKD